MREHQREQAIQVNTVCDNASSQHGEDTVSTMTRRAQLPMLDYYKCELTSDVSFSFRLQSEPSFSAGDVFSQRKREAHTLLCFSLFEMCTYVLYVRLVQYCTVPVGYYYQ